MLFDLTFEKEWNLHSLQAKSVFQKEWGIEQELNQYYLALLIFHQSHFFLPLLHLLKTRLFQGQTLILPEKLPQTHVEQASNLFQMLAVFPMKYLAEQEKNRLFLLADLMIYYFELAECFAEEILEIVELAE